MEYVDWWSVLLSFSLVIVLLLGTLWGLKHFGRFQAKKDKGDSFINVLDTKILAPRQRAVVIEIDDQRFFIGISSNGLHRLGQWQKPTNISFEETLDRIDDENIESGHS